MLVVVVIAMRLAEPVGIVNSSTAKVPLIIGQEGIASETTSVVMKTRVEVTGRVARSVIVTEIIMMIAGSYKEVHANRAQVDYTTW